MDFIIKNPDGTIETTGAKRSKLVKAYAKSYSEKYIIKTLNDISQEVKGRQLIPQPVIEELIIRLGLPVAKLDLSKVV